MEAQPAAARYVEHGVIGRGGMGEIVLCIDRDIRRPVALKRMLATTAADPSRRARFVEEAQVTGQLEHPNIVPVHELARADDGTVYFTMKLVKGRSLAEMLEGMKKASAGEPPLGKGGFPRTPSPKPSTLTRPYAPRGDGQSDAPRPPMPSLSDLLQVFLKVCDGVAFAHSRGVIHRDLKPHNILLDKRGEPFVLDWGLSWRKGDAPKSGFQHIVGTAAYMSPEQARGEERKLTPATDVYALGAVLYELFTGKPPFEAETSWKTLQMAMSLPPRPPSGLRSTLDLRVERIILHCLEKEPEARYESAKALADDLERVLKDSDPKGPAGPLGRFLEI
jgi:serine/threonine-protein kinase